MKLSGVVGEVPVDGVGDPALQRPQRLFRSLALLEFAVVVATPDGVVAELVDRDDLDCPVQLSVAALVQPVPDLVARRRFDRGGRVVARVVMPGREAVDVAGVAKINAAVIGPRPTMSVSDVPEAFTAAVMRRSDVFNRTLRSSIPSVKSWAISRR